MWKLLFDKTCAFAAAHEFVDWLKDDNFHQTKMADDAERLLAVQLAKDCGRIVGGRFVQDHRASTTIFPLLDLIDSLTQHFAATKAEETRPNKLVQVGMLSMPLFCCSALVILADLQLTRHCLVCVF